MIICQQVLADTERNLANVERLRQKVSQASFRYMERLSVLLIMLWTVDHEPRPYIAG